MKVRVGRIVLLGLCLWSSSTAAQPAQSPAHTTAMIEAKRVEIRKRTEGMQGISYVAVLQSETQRYSGMVEDLIGLTMGMHDRVRSCGINRCSISSLN
ncbi:hypothetical protein K2X89_06210 [Myxococcota bacterium]|nr:hypothetical protein [Myxococcota bacterium]